VLSRQFILGPEASGSPVHFHVDAVNMAIAGRKRWVLFPPGQRFWSNKPAITWFEEEYMALATKPIEFVQEAGDVIFIPAQWGHVVLNLEDSLAIAFEITPDPSSFNLADLA
jgi:oxalate decarboxylase/phosphoglucose isomerase-like protein (cupin superfamily)